MITKTKMGHNDGGGSGIRTHGSLAGTTVFKTVTIDRSDIPPCYLDCQPSGQDRLAFYYLPADGALPGAYIMPQAYFQVKLSKI